MLPIPVPAPLICRYVNRCVHMYICMYVWSYIATALRSCITCWRFACVLFSLAWLYLCTDRFASFADWNNQVTVPVSPAYLPESAPGSTPFGQWLGTQQQPVIYMFVCTYMYVYTYTHTNRFPFTVLHIFSNKLKELPPRQMNWVQ